MADSSRSSPSTSRPRERQRQRNAQQRRAYVQETLAILYANQTFGNAFRAWLAQLEDIADSPQAVTSAKKFVRALRLFGHVHSDFPESAPIYADTLVQWVDSMAWFLNAKFSTRENARVERTPTSRIGVNFRNLILFLGHVRIFSEDDMRYLLDSCHALQADLERTARVNRIMEDYTWYVQEAYFDVGRTVDETYLGEYEVERIDHRVLEMRKYDPEDSDTSSTGYRLFSVHVPLPLTGLVKHGDTLTLQICHLEQGGVWVPYMYSGFTPTRDENGAATPTARQTRVGTRSADDTAEALQASLARLEISSRQPLGSGSRGSGIRREARSRTPLRRQEDPQRTRPQAQTSGFEFNFNESKYTADYFRAWEGDIDSDEDFLESTSPLASE